MVKNSEHMISIYGKYGNQNIVPIFQRSFHDNKKFLKELVNTIVEDKYPYLHEIKVYHNNEDLSVFNTCLIIDGQHRMVFISLLVLAICSYCISHNLNYNFKEDLYTKVIINRQYSDERKYRLKLQERDDIAFKICVDNLESYLNNDYEKFSPRIPVDEEILSNIIPSYNYIYSLINESNIESLYYGIQTIKLKYSELESDDNFMRIYRTSNNSTNPNTLDEDVKSILLYGYSKDESKQNKLYYHYWKEMEEYFYSAPKKSLFEVFLNSYVQYKTHKLKGENVIRYFSRIEDSPKACEESVKNLYEYFKVFKQFYESDVGNLKLNNILMFLNPFMSSFTYSLLITVYQLSDSYELYHNFKLIDTHIFRNYVCTSNNVDALRRVFNLERMHSAHRLDIELGIQIKLSDFYIDNEMFERGFLNYSSGKSPDNQRKQRHALVRICQFDSGDEDFNYNNTSLEHIKSQKPKSLPKDMSPEEYEKRYCYSFKNVTLIPMRHNSKLQNKEFEEKRDMETYGYKYSKMEMTQQVASYEHYEREEMEDRGIYLFKKALQIWS